MKKPSRGTLSSSGYFLSGGTKKREKEFQTLALIIIYLFWSELTHLPLDHDGRLTDGLGDFNQGTVTGFPLRRLFLQEKAAGIGTQFVIVVGVDGRYPEPVSLSGFETGNFVAANVRRNVLVDRLPARAPLVRFLVLNFEEFDGQSLVERN